ncbi:MAG: tRNA uridine-5-carboxymethylaminomethyl(34) synthesis GTPase MnmE [Sedimentisphaerales bacterium]|nr:tRNA uridine-5-carboxymethylaminomethyl(34) synthesis GTPase MnmE [Sedimentisphaerales bacterium]
MYELHDTIVAVSSPTSDQRVIVRITGPDTLDICRQMFSLQAKASSTLLSGYLIIDDELKINAQLYLFIAPHSYTGEDVAEIHIYTNSAVTETLLSNLFEKGLRMAEPGEFTARAYLNGKLDLAQAEAVNEIIVSSNKYQLAAAEKLLDGRLGEMTSKLRADLMDLLSLIEAGLDFSGDDIEFIARDEAVKRLIVIKEQLDHLLSGSIRYESVIDLPAVGIAGAPNAGKSSLLNKLLGKERSIVSNQHKTTRDVLTGVCTLPHYRCVLFDCAGLLTEAEDILDELAQQAAIEALKNSNVVIFCADISKNDWNEDIAIRKLIEPKILVPIATKCDLISNESLPERLSALNESFSTDFLLTSTKTGDGMELLRQTIDGKLTEKLGVPQTSGVVLTARHRKAVTEAIEQINESIIELHADNDEVVVMMLRAAYQAVSDIEQHGTAHIDEQILGQIFSRFCIGK